MPLTIPAPPRPLYSDGATVTLTITDWNMLVQALAAARELARIPPPCRYFRMGITGRWHECELSDLGECIP